MKVSTSTKWRKENPDKWQKQMNAYKPRRNKIRRDKYKHLSPKEKILAYKARRNRLYHQTDGKEKAREYAKHNILRKCGMTIQEARKWYKETPKVCQICGTNENLAIDHCHKKMIIRGFLCRSCNCGIGCFHEKPKLFIKALDFIRKER